VADKTVKIESQTTLETKEWRKIQDGFVEAVSICKP
jgi:hypothetical protein